MFCWLCNAPLPIEPIVRLVATVFHFWMRLCPRCIEKYGALDEDGKLVYQAETKGK